MMSLPRAVISLDGTWGLEFAGVQSPESLAVEVPGPWTTQVAGRGDSHETVRYSRQFEWHPASGGRPQSVWMVFGGVNHHAAVFVNGVHVGAHEGAWTRFEFDVTALLVDGENTVEVVVGYPPRFGTPDQRGFLEIPHGKQSWYGTTAGIWQSVKLEIRDEIHLTDVQVAPSLGADLSTGTISVHAEISSHDPVVRVSATVALRGQICDSVVLVDGDATVKIAEPELWGIDEPNLYDVTISIELDGAVLDSRVISTGFRSFIAHDGRFILNGREIELRAVLDQDYHPTGSSVPESTEALEELFRQTRALGFTMLRVHIKRPDPRYYEIADRMGMLVWTELPSWLTWTPAVAEHGRQLLAQFIREDAHHPSIVIWTLINESWGIDLSSDVQRAWMHTTFREMKELATGSLVVDNSACVPNFHIETDIDDFHVYRGIPESRRDWDATIAEFAQRADWTFSPYGDAQRTGAEPLVLSEFGNWALPYTLDQFTDDAEPWWFRLGAQWAFGAGEGTDLLPRFTSLGLDSVFGSWEHLVTALHKAQLVANRYQTTSIRLRPEISGYVLTQLSDVQWEANGLFDMNRTPKRFTQEFALSNADFCIALRPAEYSAFVGGAFSLEVTVIPQRGLESAVPATVRVCVGGIEHVSVHVDAAARQTLTFSIDASDVSRQLDVTAELIIDGSLAARDGADLLVVDAVAGTSLAVAASDPEVRSWLTALGYAPAESPSAGAVLVTRTFDAQAHAFACAGGRVLLVVEDETALGSSFDYLPSARLGPRSGDGDWVPRNEWLDRRGAFSTIPGETLLGIAFEDLLGPLVISGIPSALRPARVSSGVFSGWLRGAATSTATIAWSEGSVTLTTLRLRHAHALTPVATALAHAMLREANL